MIPAVRPGQGGSWGDRRRWNAADRTRSTFPAGQPGRVMQRSSVKSEPASRDAAAPWLESSWAQL